MVLSVPLCGACFWQQAMLSRLQAGDTPHKAATVADEAVQEWAERYFPSGERKARSPEDGEGG